jgi:hypothetical protein
MAAFHQAMLAGAGLLVTGSAVVWFGLRDRAGSAGARATSPATATTTDAASGIG